MRRFLPFARLSIVCCIACLSFSTPAHADLESHDYKFQTADGALWERHIRIETGDQKRLLLVIDEPLDGRMQKVSFRKSFDLKDEKTFRATLSQWKNPDRHLNVEFFTTRALTPTSNPIWPITHAWDQAAENDYNNWVATQVTTTMLEGGGVKVDCADFAMTIRWLYAREHGLPAGQSLEGGGHLQGSWSSTKEWDQLPTDADWKKDERFKAALRYVLENSYTHTIVHDLYPVSITPDYVKAGTIYLTFHGDSGHTRTYLAIGHDSRCSGLDACFVQIYGNEPKAEEGYIETYEVPRQQPEGKGGLLRFRWPVVDTHGRWRLLDPKQMPGYSHEQFDWDPTDFSTLLWTRLGLYGSKEEQVAAEGRTLIGLLSERLKSTYQGYFRCSLVPCAPGSSEDQAWSTWNRDARLIVAINQFRKDLSTVDGSNTRIQQMIRSAKQPMYQDSSVSWWDVMMNTDPTLLKADPTLSIEQRWGWQTLSDTDRLNLHVAAFAANFSVRSNLVWYGQYNCVRASTYDCSKGSAIWNQYETSRLDAGFRAALQNFTHDYQNLSGQERTDFDSKLVNLNTPAEFCGASGEDDCSNYEMLVAHPEHVQTMTSEPTDSEKKRWGF